jgi:hypothetical protein
MGDEIKESRAGERGAPDNKGSEEQVLACATGQVAGLNIWLSLDVCVRGHQESNLKW